MILMGINCVLPLSSLVAEWCVPPNKQLQRTVRDKVPRHIGRRAAAELRR